MGLVTKFFRNHRVMATVMDLDRQPAVGRMRHDRQRGRKITRKGEEVGTYLAVTPDELQRAANDLFQERNSATLIYVPA